MQVRPAVDDLLHDLLHGSLHECPALNGVLSAPPSCLSFYEAPSELVNLGLPSNWVEWAHDRLDAFVGNVEQDATEEAGGESSVRGNQPSPPPPPPRSPPSQPRPVAQVAAEEEEEEQVPAGSAMNAALIAPLTTEQSGTAGTISFDEVMDAYANGTFLGDVAMKVFNVSFANLDTLHNVSLLELQGAQQVMCMSMRMCVHERARDAPTPVQTYQSPWAPSAMGAIQPCGQRRICLPSCAC